MAGVRCSAVGSSRCPTPNSVVAPVASSSSSTHPPTGSSSQSSMQPTSTLLQPQPKSSLFNPAIMSDILGQGFVVDQSTTTQLPSAAIASSSTEVLTDAPLPIATSAAASVAVPGAIIASSAVSRAVSMSTSIDRTTEQPSSSTAGATISTGTVATTIETDRRGERPEVSNDVLTPGSGSGGGMGYGQDVPLSNAFSMVDTSDTATEDDNSEDNSLIHNSNNNVPSSSRGHNITTGRQGGEGLAHSGDALMPMSASFTRSPRNR